MYCWVSENFCWCKDAFFFGDQCLLCHGCPGSSLSPNSQHFGFQQERKEIAQNVQWGPSQCVQHILRIISLTVGSIVLFSSKFFVLFFASHTMNKISFSFTWAKKLYLAFFFFQMSFYFMPFYLFFLKHELLFVCVRACMCVHI